MAQRGAQVVRNRIGKRLELLVRNFELSGSILDPFFQCRRELSHLTIHPGVMHRNADLVGERFEDLQVRLAIHI